MKKLGFLTHIAFLFALTCCSQAVEIPEDLIQDNSEENIGIEKNDGNYSEYDAPAMPEIYSLSFSERQKTAVDKSIDFSMDVYAAMATHYDECFADRDDRNMSFSPLSCNLLMGMTANHTVAMTINDIPEAMGYTSHEELNEVSSQIIPYLSNAKNTGMEVHIANSIWLNKNYSFAVDRNVLQQIQNYYYAFAKCVDFGDAGSINIMNAWVEDNTQGKIKKMFESMKAETSNVCVNTVFVNGEWLNKFDETKTDDGVFHGSLAESNVRMMHNTLIGRIAEMEECEAVVIPFNGTMEMTIVIPKNQTAEELSKNVDGSFFKNLQAKQQKAEIDLTLPRFKIETSAVMSPALPDVGIDLKNVRNILYGDNFMPLSMPNVAMQKTSLMINEDGAEMAAASAVEWLSSNPEKVDVHKTFAVDRPFLYFIQEYETGIIVMAGRVCNL